MAELVKLNLRNVEPVEGSLDSLGSIQNNVLRTPATAQTIGTKLVIEADVRERRLNFDHKKLNEELKHKPGAFLDPRNVFLRRDAEELNYVQQLKRALGNGAPPEMVAEHWNRRLKSRLDQAAHVESIVELTEAARISKEGSSLPRAAEGEAVTLKQKLARFVGSIFNISPI